MSRYWFRAKHYGWGWTPSTWQGWLTLAAFVGLVLADALAFPPRRNLGAYLGLAALAGAALIAICRWKGEPARWRWGPGKDQ
ncbi:MAG TPA: hypothetical protein VMU59_00470 [Caulobacteraceae bacterium]|nr:hypothetical protein [Caulobacteraceae bacterium]